MSDKQDEMPFKFHWIRVTHFDPCTSPKDKNVAFAIFDRCFGDKIESFPSYDAIADQLGTVHGGNTKRHIAKLQQLGYLQVVKVMRYGRISHEYTLTLPDGHQCDERCRLGRPERVFTLIDHGGQDEDVIQEENYNKKDNKKYQNQRRERERDSLFS